MNTKNTFAFLFSLFIVFSCVLDAWTDESVQKSEETANTTPDFAGKLFAIIGTSNNDNVVLSPFGIRMAMGIAGLGAEGKTLEEITETMQLQSLEKDFPAIAGLYVSNPENSNENENDMINQPSVKHDMQVFVKKDVKIDTGFLDAIKNICAVDCEEIGTNDECLSNFPAEKLLNSQLVIHDSIKFFGRWSNPFFSVRSLPFHLDREHDIQTMFMVNDEQFMSVTDFGDSYGFSLEFVKVESTQSEFAMFFIVPKEIDGIGGVMQGVSKGCLPTWIAKICNADKPRSYKLYLPRFTIDSSLELKECLSSLGLKSAFGTNADFSKISYDQPLYITNFLHDAYIDVDEHGVEASAETTVIVGTIGLRRPATIRVDRPFVYLIYDKSNHQVLFIGRCDNPVSPGMLVPNDEQPKLSEYL